MCPILDLYLRDHITYICQSVIIINYRDGRRDIHNCTMGGGEWSFKEQGKES